MKSHELAQDLLQDLFIKIFEHSTKWDEIRNPSGYLFTIARNLIIDYWRKAASSKKIEEEFWANITAERKVYEYPLIKHDEQILYQEINQVLTEQQKLIFALNRKEGFSYAEIAQKLDLSKSTVKNHMISALKKIKGHIIYKKLYPVVLLLMHFFE